MRSWTEMRCALLCLAALSEKGGCICCHALRLPAAASPLGWAANLYHDVHPLQGLLKFFRELYEGGDEDTRRAMVKSMQESGAWRGPPSECTTGIMCAPWQRTAGQRVGLVALAAACYHV